MKRKSIKFAVMTIREANQQLLFRLYQLYDNREAANITDWVMEHLTGWKKIDRIMHKDAPLEQQKAELLEQYTAALLASKPVQYVLQEAWFYGLKLFVNEHTLIPRPETEELAEWAIRDMARLTGPSAENRQPALLDVGCGSGCIAIALKKNVADAQVYACDLSEGALEVAKRNANACNTPISFFQLDFTDPKQWLALPEVNTIVSNPPYIPVKEMGSMNKNVTLYEPHLALFVENNDPLLFYRAIAGFASLKLLAQGRIYVETHEDLAGDTARVFISAGFTAVTIKKDMQGKERMVYAEKQS